MDKEETELVKDALQTSVALMLLQNIKEKQRSYLCSAIISTPTPTHTHQPLSRIYGVFKAAGFLCSFTTINTSAEVFPLGSVVWLMKAIAATVYRTASQPVKADERCPGASFKACVRL